jgi:hypothetical protein
MKLKLIKEQGYLYTEDKNWHLPLGNNPIISNLGLLPEIVVEDEVEKLAEIKSKKYDVLDRDIYEDGFEEGYKSATKTYSEEDLKQFGLWLGNNLKKLKGKTIDEIFDSSPIKQSKTPKWFVAETELNLNGVNALDKARFVLKTTTINNKTYLVGKYTNE